MRTEKNFDNISQAFVRKPGATFAQGLNLAAHIPDSERALFQHDLYCAALTRLGVDVKALRTDDAFPNGCFINDMAIITDNVVIMSNYADNSDRQGEQQAVASILGGARFLKFITGTGRLDAADVLQVRDHFYIGLSDHTNDEGAAQLAHYLEEFGHPASILNLDEENIIRLRTAATYLGKDRLLIREELAKNYAFIAFDKVIVPFEERGAANALMVNGTLLMPKGHTHTALELKIMGIPTLELDISEFEKMNGGLNCLSLRLPQPEQPNVLLMPTFTGKNKTA